MPSIDEMKKFLSDFLNQTANKIKSGEMDMTKTPEFYFRTRIRDALDLRLKDTNWVRVKARELANQISTTIVVDFSGLGNSYIPHKEFLDRLAEDSLVVIWHYWQTFESEFGPEAALANAKMFSLHIKS